MHGGEQSVQVEWRGRKLEPPSLDLGQIEDVSQHTEK